MPLNPRLDSKNGYSPPIDMTLEIGGDRISVAEVGPDFLIVEASRAIPPSGGILTITVDGEDVTREVILPDGINPGHARQPLKILTTGKKPVSAVSG